MGIARPRRTSSTPRSGRSGHRLLALLNGEGHDAPVAQCRSDSRSVDRCLPWRDRSNRCRSALTASSDNADMHRTNRRAPVRRCAPALRCHPLTRAGNGTPHCRQHPGSRLADSATPRMLRCTCGHTDAYGATDRFRRSAPRAAPRNSPRSANTGTGGKRRNAARFRSTLDAGAMTKCDQRQRGHDPGHGQSGQRDENARTSSAKPAGQTEHSQRSFPVRATHRRSTVLLIAYQRDSVSPEPFSCVQLRTSGSFPKGTVPYSSR